MTLETEIRVALETTFAPTAMSVINESHLHAGHAGDDGSGESHWRIEISAPAFTGQTRLAKHRAIHAALGDTIISRIHALSLQIS